MKDDLISDDKKLLSPVGGSEKQKIVIYRSADGKIKVDCRLESENMWLTQAQIARLFGRDVSVISRHIKTFSPKVSWTRKAICKICKFQIAKPFMKLFAPVILC